MRNPLKVQGVATANWKPTRIQPWLYSETASEQRGDMFRYFKDCYLKGQNLALTVLHVPCLIDCGVTDSPPCLQLLLINHFLSKVEGVTFAGHHSFSLAGGHQT